mgnify:CR=1 FL=1
MISKEEASQIVEKCIEFTESVSEGFILSKKMKKVNIIDLAKIISDNVMWSGKVLSEANPKDSKTIAIKRFNKKLMMDHRIQTTLLPLRDGLTLSRIL